MDVTNNVYSAILSLANTFSLKFSSDIMDGGYEFTLSGVSFGKRRSVTIFVGAHCTIDEEVITPEDLLSHIETKLLTLFRKKSKK